MTILLNSFNSQRHNDNNAQLLAPSWTEMLCCQTKFIFDNAFQILIIVETVHVYPKLPHKKKSYKTKIRIEETL